MANAGARDGARATQTDRHARSLRANSTPTFHRTDSAFDRAHGRPGSKLFFHVPARAVTIGVRPVEGGTSFRRIPFFQTGENHAR